MTLRRFSFLILALGVSVAAQARMYQWVDPNSKSPQLSGIPPAWYRSEIGGPRVRVFEQGNLIDDTAIALPPSQREDLRDSAFAELKQRQEAEALRKLELLARRRALKEKEDKIRSQRVAAERAQERVALQQDKDKAKAKAATSATVDAAMVDRLKALIGQFDRQTLGVSRTP